MKVKENENYTVLLNPNDMATLVKGNSVTFWITREEIDYLSFKLMKE